jgi:hypothetical protein
MTVNGKTVEDAASTFGEPYTTEEGFTEEAPDLRGYVTFAWDKLDSWHRAPGTTCPATRPNRAPGTTTNPNPEPLNLNPGTHRHR